MPLTPWFMTAAVDLNILKLRYVLFQQLSRQGAGMKVGVAVNHDNRLSNIAKYSWLDIFFL